jgi:hypothetical protein
MMKDCKLVSKDLIETDFRSQADNHFKSVLKIDHLASKQYKFTNIIETDGVSACIHFRCEKKVSSIKEEITQNYSNKCVIAIDPGRINIIYAEEKQDNVFKLYKLTQGQYYETCGFKSTKQLNKKWRKDFEEEWTKYSTHSPKTANTDQLDNFLGDYISIYDQLWTNKLLKKWAQQKFRVYCKKCKVLHSFFQSMHRKNEEKPIIAFGRGVASGGRGEVSVPTLMVKKICKKIFSDY